MLIKGVTDQEAQGGSVFHITYVMHLPRNEMRMLLGQAPGRENRVSVTTVPMIKTGDNKKT